MGSSYEAYLPLERKAASADPGNTSGSPFLSLFPISLCIVSVFTFRGFPNSDSLASIPALFGWSFAVSLFVFALGHKMNQMVEERRVTNTGEVLGSPNEQRMPLGAFSLAATSIATGAVLFNEGLEPSRALASQACWFIAGYVLSAESRIILERIEKKAYAH
jgi:hypothetical protein